jgi:hypothetical protein
MSRRQVIFEWACVQKHPITSRAICNAFGTTIRQAAKEVAALRGCGALKPNGNVRNAVAYKADPRFPPVGRGTHSKFKIAKVAVKTSAKTWRFVPIELLPLVQRETSEPV